MLEIDLEATRKRGAGELVAPRGRAKTSGIGDGGGGMISATCYVGNLAWTTSWQDLKDHCRQAGDVVHAKVIQDANGRSRGFGIVEFATPAAAANAILMLDQSTLDGRDIFVREDQRKNQQATPSSPTAVRPPANKRPRSAVPEHHDAAPTDQVVIGRRLYVGNLAYTVTWQMLKDHFTQAGQVRHAGVIMDGNGQSRGFGIVEFENAANAVRAIGMFDGDDLGGRSIVVREDREGPDMKASQPKSHPREMEIFVAKRIYVGNLAWSVSWQDLKTTFQRCGNVVYANVLLGDDGRSKGCGIVEYDAPQAAARAIQELNGLLLGGRPVFVREDREDFDLK